MKYIGVPLDENLHWNEQISQIKIKINRAIGILSKLRQCQCRCPENILSFII